jgi:hypothetical protein
MDRKKLRQIADDVEASLTEVGLNHDVKIESGPGKFSRDGWATVTLKISEVDDDGRVRSEEAETFRHYATSYGLKPEDLGREFNTSCGTYRIIGLKPKNRKYPVIVEHLVSHSLRKFSAEIVRSYLFHV